LENTGKQKKKGKGGKMKRKDSKSEENSAT
jgi:hypothetical protein